ncbi:MULTISPECIES: site-2 protease family protein [Flavobacterium]|uniref:Zinc metalloprotease n=1 Tax=Flavobacterium algoritolerans TaxID=3041254 RepID=A0ABT6VC41_9FLAO|nr:MULTISPECIES: site-2 protease family protein [Flavobacterium]MDI5894547.1 site-2 protease family protein [Flavobacterium algoritolerans]MDI6050396.1 site-2 protease family protein [Flavobacterium sp. XS2P24]PIF62294.1 Zn-dependent protease [Flavobacterium sp. 11]RKS14774.1 Zn-dependent protease [Flavobacterium sp. 120]
MKGSFKLGKVSGIGIFIHWTFTLLILFIIFMNYKSGQNVTQIIWSVVFILCIFVTVLLHELGHALAAKNYNIKTKDITLLPIGGLARLERLPEKPSEELIVAFAGPLVNITLAFITGIFITIPDTSEQLMAELSNGVNANNFFLNFFLVNFWLALFNLIPAFPMDGGRILRALLSFKLQRHVATRISARIGQLLAMGFIIFGFFTSPILVFIGIFVIIGAQVEADYTESKFILKGFKVHDVVMKQYPTIDANDTVKTAVELVLDSQNKNFLITEEGIPVGTLNRDQIIMALSKKGDDEFIYNVMDRNLVYLDSDSLLEKVFELIQLNKSRLMLVMENNKVVGILDVENLMEFLLINEVKINKAHDRK